ncbi:hypothetical protein AOQ84DRAFT_343564 [Glonium stellatum]|uniref:RING-type E3 ubiquitin transferase n=1 Tax=Glonium stellatum TaxID=574774 RepID=A0A8E2EWU1_9PEZI|nr:hypothetical protein AOQ84DRAFT_343564 [Glonium stellatum]
MASTTEFSGIASAAPTGPSSSQGRENRGRRGQSRSRGSEGANLGAYSDRGRDGRRGGHGGRGRNTHGRGNTHKNDALDHNAEESPPRAPPPPLPGRGTSGVCLTGDAATNKGVDGATKDKNQDVDEMEPEICFICASPVVHNAVAPCNHRTCHICALRLRALYKTKSCAHCRTNADYVIFTDDMNKRYEEFSSDDFSSSDDNLGVRYENSDIFEDTVLLLRYNCPDPNCDVACLGWPDLHRHVKSVHQKVMCDLCTRNKKVFTHEHELFTFTELKKHQKFGDDNPGAVDQSGFKGHPECGFCRQRFYGDDELYTHCRDKHERCHICDRQNQGRQQQYYVDYNALEIHFRKDHFLCPEQDCLDKKFVVFDSEMDLKAHQLEAHPHGLSKDARRDARRVDMSGFQYRAPHEPERGGRREGRGRGRGRDPNTAPIPQSSAQPLRRDELAYQRQMAIQSAQSVSNRTFGGQLTSTDAFAARPPPRAQEPVTVTAPRPVQSVSTISTSTSSLGIGSTTELPMAGSPPREAAVTPQEQARRLRHNAVTERAANILRNDQTKLTEFRSKISSYRNSKLSATELIESFFSLFDTSSVELGKLIKELADIFEIANKRDDLLKAWSDWKAINEDYPSLPGPSGLLLSGGSTAHGGSRVLKLKSSTAQSSRSAVSRQGSWGSASSSNPFPQLPSGVAGSGSRAGAPKQGATPWAASSAATRLSPVPSRVSSQVSLARNTSSDLSEAFPALPAAAKPTSTLFSPGYGGGGVMRRDNGGRSTPVNAWGAGSTSGVSAFAISPNEPAEDGAAGAGQKKKGNKNKKQTLFHFG